METYLPYFLSLNLLLILLAVYFRIFLAKQRKFQWNRFFLLGGMLAACLLPLNPWQIIPVSLPIPDSFEAPISQPTILEVSIGAIQTESIPGTTPVLPAISLTEILLWIYGLGVLISLTTLLLRNAVLLTMIRKGQKTRQNGYTLVSTSQNTGPASYFRYILWPKEIDLDAQSAAVALTHEQCHSRQLHSLDLLAMEVLKAVCWINPAVYQLRKYLRQTHEFLADQAALKVAGAAGIKRLMLMRQMGARQLTIANYFHSPVKTRLVMLTESPRRNSLLPYLLTLPLSALMVACTSHAKPAHNRISVESATERAANSPAESFSSLYNLDNMFLKAQIPQYSGSTLDKGIVCLGEMPQILNLDTLYDPDASPEAIENQPKLLNRDLVAEMIGYPTEAAQDSIMEKVVVKVLVDENGRVIRHQFLGENHPALREAVENHLADLIFRPGKQNGKVDKWWVILPFNFGMGGC